MSPSPITAARVREHVVRLGEEHPPISLDSVDRTVHDPVGMRERYGHVIDYLARVELEVDRNVLELLVLIPEVDETDRLFYADVWQPQEIHHGLILDRLQGDLGRPLASPMLDISWPLKVLGVLAHLPAVQEVVRMIYYLTGASTERQAVLAYNTLSEGLIDMGEIPTAQTVIGQIKRQEPGHFAFYTMQAELMVQDGVLAPWQLGLVRWARSRSYHLVGTNGRKDYSGDMGGVITALGYDADVSKFVREIARLETRLLWAQRAGMKIPPYFLAAVRDALALYREHGWSTPD